MRIERIEKSKHKQERVLVFLEGGDLLRITGAELLRFGLYKGMDLSPALVVELQAAAQQSQLKQTAARMASVRSAEKRSWNSPWESRMSKSPPFWMVLLTSCWQQGTEKMCSTPREMA